jgi:hypothetical protein
VFDVEQVARDEAASRLEALRADDAVVAADELTFALVDAPRPRVIDPASPDQWWLSDLAVDDLDDFEVYLSTPRVRVAILDDGVDDSHPDLQQLVVGRAPWSSGPGSNWHGTHVAGIVAAVADNGLHGRGVARHVELLDVPSGPGTATTITWAVDHGAQVINMSFCEAEYNDTGGLQCTTAWNDATAAAVAYAREHKVMLFASAGNCGPATGRSDETCAREVNRKQYPSGYTQVIGVGAYDRKGDLAGFSTRGVDVDVAAAGVDIVSTLPGDRHGASDGTSMSSPMVAGAAAALLAHRPDLQPGRILSGIVGVTRDGGAAGWDDGFGSGKIWPTEIARRMLNATPLPPPPPPSPFPLFEGQEGQAALIERLQVALSSAGYYLGSADGQFGRRTKAAVESFQADEGFDVTGQADEALLELAELLASNAPACDAAAMISVAPPVQDGWEWSETPSCQPGWALLTHWLPDTAASGWSLFRVRGDRWEEVSRAMTREAGIWLGAGTQLGERGFAELWGQPGWPYRVSSADGVARHLAEDVMNQAGTLPGTWELVAMWLDGESQSTWIDWLYLAEREQGELQPCVAAEDPTDDWAHCFLMRPAVGYPWLIRVSPELDAATFELYAFD